MAEGDTAINALLGAVVTTIFSFVLFSPIVGGLVAGYLEGGSRSEGLRVGTIAGVIALLPLLGLLVLVGGFAFMLIGVRVGVFSVLFLLVLFVFGVVYTVGLSALGGWLGNYLKYETDLG